MQTFWAIVNKKTGKVEETTGTVDYWPEIWRSKKYASKILKDDYAEGEYEVRKVKVEAL